MKKKCSVVLAFLLVLSLIGGLSVSAAGCPGMPKGADNLFKPDTMKLLGDKVLAFYENETLLCDSRAADMTYGKMAVAFDFNKKMNKEYVISFWAKSSSDSNKYMLRVLDDGEGGYCEIELNAGSAQIFSTLGGIERMYRPSNNRCLAPEKTSAMGEWKQVDIRIKPSSATTAISIYIDGEQMKTPAGATTVHTTSADRVLMVGTTAPMTMRGIRVYEVNTKAKEFEPAFDPEAEVKNAEDGTDGDNGGTGVQRIPTTNAGGDTNTTNPDGSPADGNGGEKGDNADLGLILGIAGGAVAVVAIVAVVLLVVLKKKKSPAADAQSTDKEGEDK